MEFVYYDLREFKRGYSKPIGGLMLDLEQLEPNEGQQAVGEGQDSPSSEAQAGEGIAKTSQDDSAERSRLGRKVKYLETMMASLTSTLEEQKKLLESLVEKVSKPTSTKDHTPEDDEEEIVTTKKDVLRLLEEREKRRMEEKAKYENAYVKTFQTFLSQEDDGVRTEIYNTWADKYNQVFTGDPVKDAEIGYLKAKVDVLSRQSYRGRGETPNHPTKSAMSDYGKRYNLDQTSYELAEYFGLKDDDIKAAMETDVIVPKAGVTRKAK